MGCDNCFSKNHSTEECSLCFDYKNNKRCKKCTGCINGKKYYDKIYKDSSNYTEIYDKYNTLKDYIRSFFIDYTVLERLNTNNNEIFTFTVYFIHYIFAKKQLDFWFLVKDLKEQEITTKSDFYLKNIVYEKTKKILDDMLELKNKREKENDSNLSQFTFTFEFFCDILSCFEKKESEFLTVDIKKSYIKRYTAEFLQAELTSTLQSQFDKFKENLTALQQEETPEILFFSDFIKNTIINF